MKKKPNKTGPDYAYRFERKFAQMVLARMEELLVAKKLDSIEQFGDMIRRPGTTHGRSLVYRLRKGQGITLSDAVRIVEAFRTIENSPQYDLLSYLGAVKGKMILEELNAGS